MIEHKKTWSVSVIFPLIGVKNRNYYSYLKRAKTNNFTPDDDMIEVIQNISKNSAYTYGSRRMQISLNAFNFPVERWRTAKLMKEAGVWVRYKKKYKVITNSEHKKPVFNNASLNKISSTISQIKLGLEIYMYMDDGRLAVPCCCN